jgi:hypothetical protein
MDLENAIEKHAQWKAKLRLAISRQEELNVAELSRDDCCELGTWLHGQASAQFGALPSHAETMLRHVEFHAEVADIARQVNAKRYAKAEQMLGQGHPMRASPVRLAFPFFDYAGQSSSKSHSRATASLRHENASMSTAPLRPWRFILASSAAPYCEDIWTDYI